MTTISSCVGCFLLMIAISVNVAEAGLLTMEFAGGGNEVTMAPGNTVRIDIVWTMHATDTTKSQGRMTGLDLRFNVNDVPNSDGSSAPGKFIVQSLSTPIEGWSTAAASGIGEPFTFSSFFCSAGHPDGVIGPVSNGTEFSTVVASFVLRKTAFVPGNTYIRFVHRYEGDGLPSVYDGPGQWTLQWQAGITTAHQYGLGDRLSNGPKPKAFEAG